MGFFLLALTSLVVKVNNPTQVSASYYDSTNKELHLTALPTIDYSSKPRDITNQLKEDVKTIEGLVPLYASYPYIFYSDNGTHMSNFDYFEKEKTYYVYWVLKPASGTTIPTDLKVYLGDTLLSVSSDSLYTGYSVKSDGQIVWIMAELSIQELSINSVNAKITEPTIGATPSKKVTFEAPYANGISKYCDVTWSKYDQTLGEESNPSSWVTLTDTEVFEANTKYNVAIKFVPSSGFNLTTDVVGKVNGLDHDTTKGNVFKSTNEGFLSYTWDALTIKQVTEINIETESFVVNERIKDDPYDYNLVTNFDEAINEDEIDVNWFTYNEESSLPIEDLNAWTTTLSELYENNKTYQLRLSVTLNAGYAFDENVKAMLNKEHQAIIQIDEEDPSKAIIIYTFDKLNAQEITKIDINFKTPVIGEHPTTEFTIVADPSDSCFISIDEYYGEIFICAYWGYYDEEYNSHSLDEDDVFVEGIAYILSFYLEAKEGYYFTPQTIVTYNGKRAYTDEEYVPSDICDFGYKSCGATEYHFEPLHPHAFNESWEANDTYHYHQCSCGVPEKYILHVYDDELDKTCNICSYERTISHVHEYNEIIKEETGHYYQCSCGEKQELQPHVYDNNYDSICNNCGYKRILPQGQKETNTKATVAIVIGSVATLSIGGFSVYWFLLKKKTFLDIITIFKK